MHLARPRGSVLATYSPLCLEVHANSQPSTPLPPHRPDRERFHLLRLSPDPRNAQLKRKKQSISIVGRARQRVRSSLLIVSASARHDSAFAKVPALGPRHSRSRLATREELCSHNPGQRSVQWTTESLLSECDAPGIVLALGTRLRLNGCPALSTRDAHSSEVGSTGHIDQHCTSVSCVDNTRRYLDRLHRSQ